MLISIIVPMYKGNQYIENLILMFNHNYDSLVSSDITMEVFFINDFPKIKVIIDKSKCKFPVYIIENPINLGIHKTRAKGLKICNGDYVYFLDQDDYITDNCILSQASKIEDNDFIVSNGYILSADKSTRDIFESVKHQKCCLNLDYHYGYTNPIVSPGQVLIKKSSIPTEWKEHCFQNNGADDHYLWLLLLEQRKKGIINQDRLYTHVATGNNTSLNVSAMCASNMELVSLMRGIALPKRLKMLERRTQYYKSHPERIITKIRFLDVGYNRWRFSKLKG